MFERAADYRYVARRVLKGHWQTAMLITFFAGIFSTAANIIYSLMYGPLYDMLYSVASLQETLPVATAAFYAQNTTYIVLLGIFALLGLLLSGAMSMGAINYYQKLYLMEETSFSDLFSRISIFVKCIGLDLYIGVKTLLWALPGMAVFAGAYYWIFTTSSLNWESSATLSFVMGVQFMCMALMLVPAAMAYFHYILAPYTMAQVPSAGICDSVKKSKQLMQGKRSRLFWLMFSFIGFSLVVELAAELFSGISMVVGIVVSLFGALAVSVYRQAAVVGFYMRVTGQMKTVQEHAEEQAEE